MTLYDEMKKEVEGIKKDAEKRVFAVMGKFANKSNTYEPGDIIEDHHQIGKIQRAIHEISTLSVSFATRYVCESLKKNLEPFKSGEIVHIYSTNIKKQHKAI